MTNPDDYNKQVIDEINKLKSNSDKYHVKFQIAIPASASASAHEFERLNGTATGYNQLSYVSEALAAAQILRSSPYMIGVNVWTWDQKMIWHGMTFELSQPSATMLGYLQANL